MNRELLLLALPLSLAIACGTGDEFEPCSSGQCDERETSYEVILGAETPWVKCWVVLDTETEDEFFLSDNVICELTPTGLVLDSRFAMVTLKTDDDRYSEVRLSKEEPRALVKILNGAAYPAAVEVSTYLENKSENAIYNGLTTYFTAKTFTIERGNTPSEEEPFEVTQPWDYWPVEIAAEVDLAGVRATYGIDLSGTEMTTNEGNDSSIEAAIGIKKRLTTGNSEVFYVPVTSVGPPAVVSGNAYFDREQLDYTIDGPGRYIADAEGLHRAEVEEGMN